MAKTYVIGDIHGAHIPLKQCLERSGFDKENDLLITLGDICDGWPYVYECVEELLTIENQIDITGNHDAWLHAWLKTGIHPDSWNQGGRGTAISYLNKIGKEHLFYRPVGYNGYSTALNPGDIPQTHIDFFNAQVPCYKDDKQRLFVHGGFYRHEKIAKTLRTNPLTLYWDRSLWEEALSASPGQKLTFKESLSEIFIGHTQTTWWTLNKINRHVLPGSDPLYAPMKADIIYNLDTGAGSNGKLTIMDVDTKEYWQSDQVNTIYGEYKPRG